MTIFCSYINFMFKKNGDYKKGDVMFPGKTLSNTQQKDIAFSGTYLNPAA